MERLGGLLRRLHLSRRLALAVGVPVLALLVAAGVLGLGVSRGWFDSESVEGTTEGFEPALEPQAPPPGEWSLYGRDTGRTRSDTSLRLGPPFRIAWRHDAGSLLEFPPVIADGRVVVGTNAGRALALDATTGRELWRRRLVGRVASSPALAGGVAFLTTTRGQTYALDAGTGRVLWRRKIGSSSESSPLVVGDSVYVGTLDRRVLRLDRRSGRPRWTARTPGDVKSGLALADDRVIVGDYAGTVSAFATADGRVVWRTRSPGQALRGRGRFYAGPAVAFGRVYLGNINGRMLALDQHTGEIAWVRVLGGFIYSSAAVAERTVYVGSYDERLYALDAVSGRVRWSFDAGERISGSPTRVGNLVWVSTLARNPRAGRTYAVDAATGERVFTFPDGRYTPAVATRDLLVLTGTRRLYGLVPG